MLRYFLGKMFLKPLRQERVVCTVRLGGMAWHSIWRIRTHEEMTLCLIRYVSIALLVEKHHHDGRNSYWTCGRVTKKLSIIHGVSTQWERQMVV